ncbi:hypothetical protein ACSQ9X_22870, partial [Salmonella enterica]|uniref:hypothetical protein n=1 Tax=Salmonella enterica TaxID=28901 RepID=UPI003EDBFF4D
DLQNGYQIGARALDHAGDGRAGKGKPDLQWELDALTGEEGRWGSGAADGGSGGRWRYVAGQPGGEVR